MSTYESTLVYQLCFFAYNRYIIGLGNSATNDWVILSPDNGKTWKVLNGGTNTNTGDQQPYICQYDG